MASEYEDRKGLTFEQAEGAEPLPSQLKLREVSRELRARLWAVFVKLLQGASVILMGGNIYKNHFCPHYMIGT
jgi:hypothetical protein